MVILQNSAIVALFGVAGLAFALGWPFPVQALGTLLGYAYGHFVRLLEWATIGSAWTEVWITVAIELGAAVYGLILSSIVAGVRPVRGDVRLRSPFLAGLTIASCGAVLLVFALLGS